MAISSTRVKFLDKENKVLVKPIKDFISNDIFSNVVTPLLDNDLVNSFLSSKTLLNLQSGITSLSNLLNDFDVSKFSINNLLKDLNFSDPSLAHLGGIITTIKGMNDATVTMFMNSVMQVTNEKLLDNPSLVNLYQSISPDAKIQTILASLDVFTTRLNSGELNQSSFTKELKTSAGDKLSLSEITNLLGVVKANNKTIDLRAVVPGDAKLGKAFLDELAKLDVISKDEGNGVVLGSENGTLTKVTDNPYINSLLVAYLTIKRSYFRVYTYKAIEKLMTPSALDFLYSYGNAFQAVSGHFSNTLKNSRDGPPFVTPVYQNDAMLAYLTTLFAELKIKARSPIPYSQESLSEILDLVKLMIDNTLMHPNFIGMKTTYNSVMDFDGLSIKAAINYIKDVTTPFDFTDDVVRGSLISGMKAKRDESARDVIKVYNANVNGNKDIETLGIPILYVRYVLLNLLLSARVDNLKSSYSVIWLCADLFDPIFSQISGQQTEKLGFPLGRPMFVKEDSGKLLQNLENITKAVVTSDVWLLKIDQVPVKDRMLYNSLKWFPMITATKNITVTAQSLADPSNFAKLVEAFTERTGSYPPGYAATTFFTSLDTLEFTSMAVNVDRITFSGNKVKIL